MDRRGLLFVGHGISPGSSYRKFMGNVSERGMNSILHVIWITRQLGLLPTTHM
jgi:hypothetical protein